MDGGGAPRLRCHGYLPGVCRVAAVVFLLFTVYPVIYGFLGAFGWFIDGLLLSTPLAIPLATVDNIFRVALAAGAFAGMVTTVRKRQYA